MGNFVPCKSQMRGCRRSELCSTFAAYKHKGLIFSELAIKHARFSSLGLSYKSKDLLVNSLEDKIQIRLFFSRRAKFREIGGPYFAK